MRVKTGIPGLDKLIDGGLPKDSLTLVSGECGTGKTIFAVQYLVKGITDYDEPGVLVSFERESEPLCREMRRFGWHLKALQNQGNLRIIGGPLDRIMGLGERAGAKPEDLIAEMIEVVEEMGAERFALDRSVEFSMTFPDKIAYRSGLGELKGRLEELGCTSIVTSQVEGGSKALSGTGVEEQIADGIIVLHPVSGSYTRRRAIEIRKMSGTRHSDSPSSFEITDEGIVVKEEPSGKSSSSVNISEPSRSLMLSELRFESRVRPWRCVLCGREIDGPLSFVGGGRASFCGACISKLEGAGYLERVDDSTLKLQRKLLDLLADYSSL